MDGALPLTHRQLQVIKAETMGGKKVCLNAKKAVLSLIFFL